MSSGDDPETDWDELLASADLRELFRYQRRGEIRVYSLRIVSTGAELWRITEQPQERASSVKEADLKSSEEALEAIEDIERSLSAGGWRRM
jgi:hypothetical protein